MNGTALQKSACTPTGSTSNFATVFFDAPVMRAVERIEQSRNPAVIKPQRVPARLST